MQHSANPFVSRIKMKGTLTIHVRDAVSGALIRTIRKRNTITYNAGNVIRSLLSQRTTDPPPAQYQLGSMRFGVSGVAPTRDDANLIGEVIGARQPLGNLKKIDGVSGELSLQATLDPSTGNGNTFQEAGLFTFGPGAYDDPTGSSLQMFARQIHTPQIKTSLFTFDYDWTLQFTT